MIIKVTVRNNHFLKIESPFCIIESYTFWSLAVTLCTTLHIMIITISYIFFISSAGIQQTRCRDLFVGLFIVKENRV